MTHETSGVLHIVVGITFETVQCLINVINLSYVGIFSSKFSLYAVSFRHFVPAMCTVKEITLVTVLKLLSY